MTEEAAKNRTSKAAAAEHVLNLQTEGAATTTAVTEPDTQPFTKEKLSVTEIDKMLQNKTAFTEEQIGNMYGMQLETVLENFLSQIQGNTKANTDFRTTVQNAIAQGDTEAMKTLVSDNQEKFLIREDLTNALITSETSNAEVDSDEGVADELENGGIDDRILERITMDETGISQLETIRFKPIETQTAEHVNQWWKDNYQYDPPYLPGSKATVVELTEKTRFVRVYDKQNSAQKGGWVMLKEDIEGLTLKQIQDKYALLTTPVYVTDVILEPGSQVRISIANNLNGFTGGGIQFDLMDQWIGSFKNESLLNGGMGNED